MNLKMAGRRAQKRSVSLSTAIITNYPDLAVAAAESLQARPTLCNPTDGSPPGSPIPGILQARKAGGVGRATP